MDASIADKLARMRDILRGFDKIVVAFSGGVDSTFVLKVAVDARGPARVVAVTGASDSVADREMSDAKELAKIIGAEHVLLSTREFDDANYLANPVNRCYYCKTELYGRIAASLTSRGPFTIVSGTNADDLGDFRPGLAAAKEHGVRAPCAEVGLTKAEIRELSASMGLPTADKPASPCLSSRVQYGEAITPEKLRMIEQGETALRELGLRECRVRHHDKLARIEVPEAMIERMASEDVRNRITDTFRKIGYQYVTLDLQGFRSGSMNEVIAFGRRQ